MITALFKKFPLSEKILYKDLSFLFIFLSLLVYPYSIIFNNITFGISFIFLIFYLLFTGIKSVNKLFFYIFYFFIFYFFLKVCIDFIINNTISHHSLEKYFSFLFFPLFGYFFYRSGLKIPSSFKYIIIISANLLGFICLSHNVLLFLNNDISFAYFTDWKYVSVNLMRPVNLHTTYAGFWVLISIVFLFDYDKHLNRYSKLFFYFDVCFLIFFILLISSRVIIFSLSAYFLVKSVKEVQHLYRNRKFIKLTFGILLSILTISFVYKEVSVVKWRFKELTYNLSETDYSKITYGGIKIRLIMAECALKNIKQDPIFGSNVFSLQKEMNDCYTDLRFFYGRDHSYGSHNQYLETTLDFGLVGLLLLLFYLIFPLYLYQRDSLKWVIVIFAVCFISENMLSVQKGLVLWNFFVFFAPSFKFKERGDHVF